MHKILLPAHKTKIICTVGPASNSVEVLKEMARCGMNVARLNFSHGDFAEHRKMIHNVHQASAAVGREISILVDLPGAKMRVGTLAHPINLKKGQKVTLTTKPVKGHSSDVIPVEYKRLPQSATKGGIIYLSDGFIQLKVEKVTPIEVECRVVMEGELFSHKGLNLPGAKLFIDPITRKDLELVDFSLEHGISIFGLSFIEQASDVEKVRSFARKKGKDVHLIAKIERRDAIANFDAILKASDGIMIARGDMGVEIPIEEVPMIQKQLIQKANIAGRPVITATQLLVSMTENVRPTRAEVNDVANAILDGTDAIMFSEETAIGKYPVQTVQMGARIAVVTEGKRADERLSTEDEEVKAALRKSVMPIPDVISLNAVRAAEKLKARYIVTPTTTGNTARRVSRFKPHCWVIAFSVQAQTCRFLAFSYGVYPLLLKGKNHTSAADILKTLQESFLTKRGDIVIVTERRLSYCPGETDSMGIVELA